MTHKDAESATDPSVTEHCLNKSFLNTDVFREAQRERDAGGPSLLSTAVTQGR